jgi:hypothetical protein
LSHSPERKEKDCLNCGTIIHGRFSHVCGQENIEPKETFWSMVVHFFNDITHFDGKFFTSIKWLIRKPGFLSSEYIAGRRARYLHPIRMYVFSSAVFFIIFFSLVNGSGMKLRSWRGEGFKTAITDFSAEAYKNAKTKEDTASVRKALSLIPSMTAAQEDTSGGFTLSLGGAAEKYASVAEYDSVQASLPASDRDNWLKKSLNKKGIVLEQKYKGNKRQLWADMIDKFLHSIPYMLFISLPLYALWLKLLYVRRKKFYYADHGVFLIHLYVFTFLLLLFIVAFDKLRTFTGYGIWGFIEAAFGIAGIYYAFRAMYKFYRQGVVKTLLKFFIFNTICLFCLIFLFTVFFLVSFYRV